MNDPLVLVLLLGACLIAAILFVRDGRGDE